MVRFNFFSSSFCYGVVVFIALPSAHAQLLSCAEIDCPVNSYMQSTCQINGSDISTLGFTNFTTSLTTAPLSWTVGYNVGLDDVDGNSTDERFYYLGTPPALNLNTVSSVLGCALSFDGIQSDLSFLPPGSSVSDMSQVSGTCSDALGATCVSDLIQQSLKHTDELNGNGTFQCSSLANFLKNNPPASCSVAGTTWGDILVKELTGPDAASKIELDNCHPTVNQTYDIRTVISQSSVSQHNFFNAITPILTIFAPVSGSRDSGLGPILSSSEAHLSCMKPVSNKPTTGFVAKGDARKNPSNHLGTLLLLGMSLWSAVWWLSL